MDAIAVLMPLFNSCAKHYYVIEGDIKSYFDNVHHRKLMGILRRRIADGGILDLIWKFLKAGVMEGGLFARTESGVPQGSHLAAARQRLPQRVRQVGRGEVEPRH